MNTRELHKMSMNNAKVPCRFGELNISYLYGINLARIPLGEVWHQRSKVRSGKEIVFQEPTCERVGCFCTPLIGDQNLRRFGRILSPRLRPIYETILVKNWGDMISFFAICKSDPLVGIMLQFNIISKFPYIS